MRTFLLLIENGKDGMREDYICNDIGQYEMAQMIKKMTVREWEYYVESEKNNDKVLSSFVLADIAIAKAAIDDVKLFEVVRDKRIVCDIYCRPPFHWHTSYVAVYQDDDEYIMLFAKTFFADYNGLQTTAATFFTCKEALEHNGKVGKMICGVKRFSFADNKIGEILDCLPKVSEAAVSEKIYLDGVFTAVRRCENNTVKATVSYREAIDLSENKYTDDQIKILDNLFATVNDFVTQGKSK